jgi:hypothetical protein
VKPQTLQRRLATYFERYDTTLQILTALLRGKAAHQDIILLACARLDSLANHAMPGKITQHEKFVRLLLMHSGHRDVLDRVSVADLYASVLVEWWQLPGMLDLPGRLQVFDLVRQRDFVEMYWRSGLALTEKDIEGLMAFLAQELRRRYRVIPYQRGTKPQDDTVNNIMAALTAASTTYRKGRYTAGISAFKPIVQAYRLAAILYREYRNGSIHGAGVGIDEDEFFRGTTPRWTTVEYEFAAAKPIFQVVFPGKFLLSLYENCFRGYHKQLLSTQKLPPSIYNEVFPNTFTRHLAYLDQRAVEPAIELRPRPDRT